MKDTPWDHGLRVTAEDGGLVGHAGAVLGAQRCSPPAGPSPEPMSRRSGNCLHPRGSLSWTKTAPCKKTSTSPRSPT